MAVVWQAFSKWYFNKLTTRLARVGTHGHYCTIQLNKHAASGVTLAGLTYHDAIAETGVYEKAISRLPTQMQTERYRRIKRAFDLSSKHEDIPAAAQESPWREYKQVQQLFADTQKEVDERKHLTDKWWMPFHIGRETWHPYDTKTAWFWQSGSKKKTLPSGKQF